MNKLPKNVTEDDRGKAYHEGRRAFYDGKPQSSNPYTGKGHALLAVAWEDGWVDAEIQDGPRSNHTLSKP
jgi:hypothetical protein